MSTINAMRLRQKAQRLELPDKPVSTTVLQSVDAACNKYLEKRGMMYKWTSSYSGKRVKKELGAILTRGKQRIAVLKQAPSQRDLVMVSLYL